MSTTSVDNDLQTYFDSFKEIDEGNTTLITLSPGTMQSTSADEAEEKLLQDVDDDQNKDNVEEDDDTCYIDGKGNYYFHTQRESSFANSEDRKSTTRNYTRTVAGKAAASTLSIVDEEEVDYKFILSTDDDALQSFVKTKNVEIVENEIYEFNNEEMIDDPNSGKSELVWNVVPKADDSKSNSRRIIYSCTHCDYTTEKRFILSRHLKGHSDERPFKCSVCERPFKTSTSLMNHINVHLGNKPHECKYCEMCFTTSGELQRHVRYRHTGEKPHKCGECDYSSVELSKLRRHIRCHTGERPYQCPHCTYASPDSFKLKRHIRIHTGEKPYECDICHACFSQSNSLKSHRLIHTIGDKPVFQCSLCPTTCGRKTDLRMHTLKLHHSDHPINCKRCGKDLPDRYSYKMHIKTHDGEKCYRCQICSYASASVRHLETHMLIHTNEKPFVCPKCDQSFRQRQLLKRHMNLYHNKDYVPPTPREKAHMCPHCQRAFTHKGNLMRHMELHDPESNAHQERINLQIDQRTRIRANSANSTITTGALYSDKSDAEYEDGYEIIETVDEKPAISQQFLNNVPIKKEVDNKEFMAVEMTDGQQYVVVIDCDGGDDDEDDDDDDDDENCLTLESTFSGDIKISNASKLAKDAGNAFGFNDDEHGEYMDDTKAGIKLLDIIEEDG